MLFLQTLRSVSEEALTPIKEAITIAEATPSFLLEKSSVCTGSVPFSFLTGRANPSKSTYKHKSAGC